MNDKELNRRRDAAHETRAQDEAHPPVHGDVWDTPWKAASNLEAPPPNDGMVQRWIRIGIRGEDDPSNIAKQDREGWVPRRADTVKGARYPTIGHGQYAGCIGVHGMILCEMPRKRIEQRAAHFRKLTDRQTQAVEHDLERPFKDTRGSVSLEKTMRSRTSFGRRPKVADAVEDDS